MPKHLPAFHTPSKDRRDLYILFYDKWLCELWLELSAGLETHERKQGREMGLQHFLGTFCFLCIYIFQDKTALLIRHKMALPQGYKVKSLIMKWTACRGYVWKAGEHCEIQAKPHKILHLLLGTGLEGDWKRKVFIFKWGMPNFLKEQLEYFVLTFRLSALVEL